MTTPESAVGFVRAVPVWPDGSGKGMNVLVGFRAVFQTPAEASCLLRVTGASIYRVWLNGRFAGHGPARAAHGFARVDEWPLNDLLPRGRNLLAIEVAGYEVNSYYVVDQPAFLQAEIVVNGQVVAATGMAGDEFEAVLLPERLQRMQRFSWQRTFVEGYQLQPDYDGWRRDASLPVMPATLGERKGCRLIPRGVPFPAFEVRRPQRLVAEGSMRSFRPPKIQKDRSLTQVGPDYKGFPESDLDFVLSTELQCFTDKTREEQDRLYEAESVLELPAGHWVILDMGVNLTGFIGLKVLCTRKTRLIPLFDEILDDGKVRFDRLSPVAALSYELNPGVYELESIEPYTFRYLRLQAVEGSCRVDDVYVREMANPDSGAAEFSCADDSLNTIFEAGRETFRQNALDIFMDCPSRERAGWLCDSFFTGRVEQTLCGHNRVERNFLENFLLPDSFGKLPAGMLPMCYPADHPNGRFIPNWALWFILELEEYLLRTGDRGLVDALKPKIEALFAYFQPFLNSDGLLEKLESWVFIEWSNANKFVQDVNYPSNMLYSGALASAGRIYGEDRWAKEAARVAQAVREQSFDGTFFVDNALRKDGRLEITRNRSETCQYYAFFFDVATPVTHAELWTRLLKDFGPVRKTRNDYPEVHASNAFIGEYLRMELLSRHGEPARMLDEMKAFLLPMARKTGTLWENLDTSASCNHAFASHACHALLRDLLGVAKIDTANRRITVRVGAVDLDWCKGRIPFADGAVEVNWRREGSTLRVRTSAPDGYAVDVTGPAGMTIDQTVAPD